MQFIIWIWILCEAFFFFFLSLRSVLLDGWIMWHILKTTFSSVSLIHVWNNSCCNDLGRIYTRVICCDILSIQNACCWSILMTTNQFYFVMVNTAIATWWKAQMGWTGCACMVQCYFALPFLNTFNGSLSKPGCTGDHTLSTAPGIGSSHPWKDERQKIDQSINDLTRSLSSFFEISWVATCLN